MRPLRRGSARTGLAEGLERLLHAKDIPDRDLDVAAQRQAAVLGGAIEQAIEDMLVGQSSENKVEFKQVFWRLTNENLWRLTRSLEASGLLDKAGQ